MAPQHLRSRGSCRAWPLTPTAVACVWAPPRRGRYEAFLGSAPAAAEVQRVLNEAKRMMPDDKKAGQGDAQGDLTEQV